jgi:hypothetical protein
MKVFKTRQSDLTNKDNVSYVDSRLVCTYSIICKMQTKFLNNRILARKALRPYTPAGFEPTIYCSEGERNDLYATLSGCGVLRGIHFL